MIKPYYETKLGKLYHGDCLEIMPELEPVDLVLTDPPYGLNEKLRGGVTGMMKGCFNEMVADGWDVKPTKKHFKMIFSISDNQIIWGGNYFIEYLRSSQGFFVWNKMNGTNQMADCEMAWTSFEMGSKMFSMHHFSAGYDKKKHPTQKPTKLFIWCLGHSRNSKNILDPFIGSGTTAIACERLKRKWIGIEIEEKYCEIAAKRIEENLTVPERIERSEKGITKKTGLLF